MELRERVKRVVDAEAHRSGHDIVLELSAGADDRRAFAFTFVQAMHLVAQIKRAAAQHSENPHWVEPPRSQVAKGERAGLSALDPARDTLCEGDQFALPHDPTTWYTLGRLAAGETFQPGLIYRRPAGAKRSDMGAAREESMRAEGLAATTEEER